MERFKKKIKGFLGLGVWVLSALFLISTARNIERVISIRHEVAKEKERVEKMESDNARLQDQINESQGNDFIEKQIRDGLGLAKAGEAIVILPDESIVRSLAPPKTLEEETLPDPNWAKWKKLFF